MLRELHTNKRGIVFITVLMIIIVMIVLTISVVSMNVSQVLVAESEVKRLQGEILGIGAIAYTFANQLTDTASNTIILTETIDNTTFTITANITQFGQGPLNTDVLDIEVSY